MPATFRNFYMRADQDYHDKLFGDYDTLEKKLGQSHIRIYDRTLPEALVSDPVWVKLTPNEKNSILSDSAKLATICKTLKERYHKRIVIDNYLQSNLTTNYLLLGAVNDKGQINFDALDKSIDTAISVISDRLKQIFIDLVNEANLNNWRQKSKKAKTQAQNPISSTGTPTPPQNEDPNDPEFKKKHPHGKYEDAPYHHRNSNGKKSPAPKNGQKALDNSVEIESSKNRVGLSSGEIVILNRTSEGVYHGHVRNFKELSPPIIKALRNQGWLVGKGTEINWPLWAK